MAMADTRGAPPFFFPPLLASSAARAPCVSTFLKRKVASERRVLRRAGGDWMDGWMDGWMESVGSEALCILFF